MQVFQTIRSLPRKVSREEALRHFTGGGRGIVASILRGRAQSIAEVFIPFTIFQVKIRNREREEMKIYALDAVAGSLDLFEFPETPAEAILATHTTRNFLRARLTPEQAQEKLTDKVRRLVFSRGFAQLRDLRIEAIANPADLHVPYWICFRGDSLGARMEILDAVRRRFEGAKVKALVEDWLRLSPSALDAGCDGDNHE